MEECKRMGLQVLGPDVNESFYEFTVNDENAIRFGMGAVKGVGSAAVETIIENRKDGPYQSIFDMTRRIDLRAANKKALESLIYAGGFDSFAGTHRAQYFYEDGDGGTTLEKAIKYGIRYKENENSAQASLFGGTSDVQMPEPALPICPEWGLIEKLKYEKDVIGIYLTSHPLDNYRFEITHFCQHRVRVLHLIDKIKETAVDPDTRAEFDAVKNKDLLIGGMITAANHRMTKTGKPFGVFTIEDYSDSYEIALFGEDYVKYKGYLSEGYFIQLRGVIMERFRQPGNWGFEIKNIQLLSELRDKLAKSLTIHIPLESLNQTLLDQFQMMLEENEKTDGNKSCHLRFKIFDRADEIAVEMPSKSLRINPDDRFIGALNSLETLTYRLN